MKESVSLLGIRIDIIDEVGLHGEIDKVVRNGQKKIFANTNLNALNLAMSDKSMKEFLLSSHVNFIDGDGVNLALTITGQNTGPKITYDWWIWRLVELAAKKKYSMYLLGANENVIQIAIEKLKIKYPEINIVGFCDGYSINNAQKNKKILEEIATTKPNILIVGMGMPKQEKWILDNYDKLNFNVVLNGGAVFDYVAGNMISTPNIFRRLKLEWFFRFLQKPNYLFKRYFLGIPLIISHVIFYHFVRKE